MAKSVPVLYFGNLQSYLSSPVRIITVGLNPSANEFPSENPELRFPGASEDSQPGHFAALNQYFEKGRQPLWEWFIHFDVLLGGMGAGFLPGRPNRAIHTDLCSPVATDPTFSRLPRQPQRELERIGLPIWSGLAALLDPDVIVMSGGIPLRERVDAFAGARWLRIFGEGRKSVVLAETGAWGRPRVAVFGLTTNVPFGALSFQERRAAGAVVAGFLRSGNLRAVPMPGQPSSSVSAFRAPSQAGKETVPLGQPLLKAAQPPIVKIADRSARAGAIAPAVASYSFSRLCFRRDVIEPLGADEAFRIVTPAGTFQMTKSEFCREFHNVVASPSYREGGIYHYPKLPARQFACSRSIPLLKFLRTARRTTSSANYCLRPEN